MARLDTLGAYGDTIFCDDIRHEIGGEPLKMFERICNTRDIGKKWPSLVRFCGTKRKWVSARFARI
jgi:hypothetical protein